MRWIRGIVTVLLAALLIGAAALFLWLWASPPSLLKVGSGYAAKIVCSNVFLAGRDPDQVLALDVQAPGNPLLRLMRVSVDREAKRVHAALLGSFAPNDAVYRDGMGCTTAPDGVETVAAVQSPVPQRMKDAAAGESLSWPEGEKVDLRADLSQIVSDPVLAGPGMRAIVVVKDGRIVAENYGEGFSRESPLVGWSMTKTVTAMLIGRLVHDGRMQLDAAELAPTWTGDRRREITLRQMLAMESGLAFNEDYGALADVTRMLYLTSDMAEFVASRQLENDPGTRFHYSSGDGVLMSRIWMEKAGRGEAALGYPRTALFSPLGMTSAVLEADAVGTFVGSSYMYATARDWARLGLFLAQDGMWNGNRLLPEGFVHLMRTPSAHSNGRYSQMQTWLPKAGDNSVAPDTFYMRGHDGQTIAVMPSRNLVIVRMGLTPSSLRYDPGLLFGAVAKATGVTP